MNVYVAVGVVVGLGLFAWLVVAILNWMSNSSSVWAKPAIENPR